VTEAVVVEHVLSAGRFGCWTQGVWARTVRWLPTLPAGSRPDAPHFGKERRRMVGCFPLAPRKQARVLPIRRP